MHYDCSGLCGRNKIAVKFECNLLKDKSYIQILIETLFNCVSEGPIENSGFEVFHHISTIFNLLFILDASE